MDTILIRHALLVGFAVAAPVGPISVLVIRRNLTDGRLYGLVAGLGAATADALYALAGAFATSVAAHMVAQSNVLHAAGGLFMCWFGVRTWRAVPGTVEGKQASPDSKRRDGYGYARAFGSTLFLTLMSPTTILSFAGISAGIGLGVEGTNHSSVVVLVACVFLGSAFWWLLLSGAIGLLRQRLSARVLRTVNRVSGSILIAFGVFALVHAVPWSHSARRARASISATNRLLPRA